MREIEIVVFQKQHCLFVYVGEQRVCMCLCRWLCIIRNSAINPFAKTYSENFDCKLQTLRQLLISSIQCANWAKALFMQNASTNRCHFPYDLPLGEWRLSYFFENRLCFIELVGVFVDSFRSYHIELICKHQKFIKNCFGISDEIGKDDDDDVERRSHATI